MARKPPRPRDVSQLAKRIVDITTGEAEEIFLPLWAKTPGSAGRPAPRS